MASIPIQNPQIPFLGAIPGGFRPSLMIRMKGKMTTKRGRCTIDFFNSPALNNGQDIMFHLSIRMDEKCIVRNSFINQRWAGEERYGAFRIGYNDPFEIIILAEFQHYKIAVNGCHLGVFRHRLPLHLVQYIHVKGDVTVEHILFEQDVKSAQEQAGISQLIGAATSATPATSYHVIGSSTTSIPSNYHVIGATTTAVPTYQIIGSSTSAVPANQQFITTSVPSAPPIHSTYEPPPPYPTQQNQTWLATPFFEVEKRPGRVVFKTSKNESSFKF